MTLTDLAAETAADEGEEPIYLTRVEARAIVAQSRDADERCRVLTARINELTQENTILKQRLAQYDAAAERRATARLAAMPRRRAGAR